ncbi:MAG: protein kinase [Acidobacteriia bacterium]|nr:protein kinase [Terriglobia bacterium]
MGVVYRAHDLLIEREVALKTILDVDDVTAALFYDEWNLLATMVHPNVINIFDIGEFEHEGAKKPFLVMPLLPGVGLDQLIREGSPRLSVTGVLNIAEQACRGLHAAHQRGLVHRDVKPSNIFVMEDNSVKVTDFGIAREDSTTHTNWLRGMCPYMAPEQFARQRPTPLSDLFSLGVVTYEALSGRRPFEGANEDEIIDAICRQSPPPVSALNREVSLAISQVVAKAIAKQPEHRFSSMREFGDALQNALGHEPLEGREEVSRLYQAAVEEWDKGEVASALSHLEALIAVDRENPEGDTGQSGIYRDFYNQVHAEHNALNSAYEQARRSLAADEFDKALAVSKRYLSKYPNHALFRALQGDAESRQRQKLAAAIVETDRRLQAEPDPDRQLGILLLALKLYPHEPHFEAALRSVRDKRDLAGSLESGGGSPELGAGSPEPGAGGAVPGVGDPGSGAGGWEAGVASQGSGAGSPGSSPPPATAIEGDAARPEPAPSASNTLPPALPVAESSQWPSPALFRKILFGIVGGLGVLLLVAVTAFVTRHREPPGPHEPVQYKVSLIASAPGAEIKLNGQICGSSVCELTLGAGKYRAEAQLAGYQPASATFNVSAEEGAPTAVDLTLVPAPPLLTFSTDLREGSVLVDGAPAGPIQDGGAEVPRLSPGKHVVSVRSGDLQSSFNLEIAAAGVPRIFPPIQVKGVRVFVLAELGREARLYGSDTDTKVTLDGRPMGDLVRDGVELKDLALGTHELTFEKTGGLPDKMIFESKPSVAVYVRMKMSRRAQP